MMRYEVETVIEAPWRGKTEWFCVNKSSSELRRQAQRSDAVDPERFNEVTVQATARSKAGRSQKVSKGLKSWCFLTRPSSASLR